MENKLKAYLSLASIILFGLATMASLGPDASTNTTVAPSSNCAVRPANSGPIHIFISYRDNNGTPIPNAAGTIFITHEAVGNTVDCKYTNIQYFVQPFTTDSEGNFGANGWDFTHTDAQDVYRVEVLMKRTATHTGYKEVQAGYYNVRNFDFLCTGLKKIEL